MKKLLYSLSFLTAFFLLIASCTKIRTTSIGSGLIPAVDNVTVFDTVIEVESEIVPLPDSSRVIYSADHALGILEDPTFGVTNAEVYLQLLAPFLSSTPNPQPFGSRDSLIGLDSVVLSLRYKSIYGDSNTVGNFKVYEIDASSNFRDSSLGYLISQPSFPVTNLLGQRDAVLFSTLNDSLQYKKGSDTIKTGNEIRISLDNAFGMRLMDLDSNVYKNDTNYNTLFKGFALKIDPASSYKRALVYVNLLDAGTRLAFHYRKTVSGVADTVVTEFTLRTKHNANLITRNNSGTPYQTNLANGTGSNQQELYLQSTPGSVAMLKIPGLPGLTNRLIYRAALIAEKLDGQEDNYFTEPNLLFLDAIDTGSTGNGYLTIPKSFQGTETAPRYDPLAFGGFLKEGKFEFDLTRYVQGIATNNEHSFALRLYAPYTTKPFLYGTPTAWVMNPNTSVAKGRVIVGGGANPTKKLRLYIVYSKI